MKSRIMPLLLHNKALKSSRVKNCNIQHKFLFSAKLKMSIECIVSTKTLRMIDYHGGLDEYIVSQKLYCPIAQMYQRRIAEKI